MRQKHVHALALTALVAVFSGLSIATGEAQQTATPASGDEVADRDVFPLPEVAVTGKKVEAPPSLIVRRVTPADIEARNAHTVADALTYVPGVNVQIGGSSGDARAWIRGYRDRDVLVLFDGIPIASGFEGTIDLKEIAIQRIAGINVMKSAPSVIYGTNGVGGVIDVVPTRITEDRFLDAQAELGGNEARYLRATGGGRNGALGFALSVQHQSADDYALSDDYPGSLNQPPGPRLNSDFERNNLFLQLATHGSSLGTSSLFVSLADAEKGLAVEAGVDDPDYERLTESKRRTVGFSHHFDRVPLSFKAWYNGYDSELTAYTDASYREIDDIETNTDTSYGGRVYSTIPTSASNTLVTSVGFQAEVFEGEGELESGNQAELATWTLAVEDQFWITRRLSLAAGGIFVRFDQTRLGRTTSEFNPQLALAWQLGDRLSLHASAAQRTRFPKLRELYRRRYGNPDLDPQTSENYEAGLMYRHGNGWTSDLALFRSDIDGLIERTDRRSPYTNLDPVTIEGVEAATGGWWGERFYTRLAYTWVDAAEDLPDGGSRQLRSRPEHTALVEFRYRLPHDITLSFSGIYVRGLYDLDPDGVHTRLPAYFVAHLKARWAFAEHYEAYLAVSNLDDTDYLHRIGDPREGRAFLLGIRLDY